MIRNIPNYELIIWKNIRSGMEFAGYLKVVRHSTTCDGDMDILFFEQVSLVDAVVQDLSTLMRCQRYWIVRLQDRKVIVPFVRKSNSQERDPKGEGSFPQENDGSSDLPKASPRMKN